jgi:putrescine transport system ATP-binding protein
MAVTLSVRPERVALARRAPDAEFNWGRGVVTNLAYLGGYTLCHVRLRSGKVVVANVSSLALTEFGPPALGEDVFISWSPASSVVLTQ